LLEKRKGIIYRSQGKGAIVAGQGGDLSRWAGLR
jgi:DNA-binding GntR family transcriptional regulator